MMELCKSDTDEEENVESLSTSNQEDKTNGISFLVNNDPPENVGNNVNNKTDNKVNDILLELNDNNVKSPAKGNDVSNETMDEAPSLNQNGSENPEDTHDTEMNLVYNDSVEETEITTENLEINTNKISESACQDPAKQTDLKEVTEVDSQLVSLHYDSEKTEVENTDLPEEIDAPQPSTSKDNSDIGIRNDVGIDESNENNEFSDDEMNMEEIDRMILNAEILKGLYMRI